MRALDGFWLCFILATLGCGEQESSSPPHVGRTSGSAIALSYDERVAVATNRSSDVVTVFALKPERGVEGMVTGKVELPMEPGSEPWSAVIGADGETAYVLLRGLKQLVRIDDLRSESPRVAEDEKVDVGAEPMGLAISPTGKIVFVANWGEGTISKIDTEPFVNRRNLDLNGALRESGAFSMTNPGDAMAHPRALTITDDGDQDDDDETLYITEFFSQPLPEADPTHAGELARADFNRQGFVYSLSVGSGQPGPTISIGPTTDTGFVDSNGAATGCFPNQLLAAAAHEGRLYVTAMCTSPRGPLGAVTREDGSSDPANFKTLFHPAVYAIDTNANEEVPDQSRLLTRVLQTAYDEDQTPDDSQRRMPLTPHDIALRGTSAGASAYVLALGADAMFRLDYDPAGNLRDIGSPHHRFVAALPSQGFPIGVAVSHRSKNAFALALSDTTRQLSIIDLTSEAAPKNRLSVDQEPTETQRVINNGRSLFATGLGNWSYKGQAWSSCEGCHPGGLSDGVVWYFSRGPRRSLSTANTYEKVGELGARERRLLLWGANVDEIHDVEVIVRGVSGGAGAILWQYPPRDQPSNGCRLIYDNGARPMGNEICAQAKPTSYLNNGLNGALTPIVDGQGCLSNATFCDSSGTADWNDVDTFIRSLRAPQPPTNLDSTKVVRGRAAFREGRCAGCHADSLWTISMMPYVPGAEATGALPYQPMGAAPATALPPLGTLRETMYTVPEALASLNPVAEVRDDCLTGTRCARFRDYAPAPVSAALSLLYDNAKSANDQIRCALRNVGTFSTTQVGIAPLGAPVFFEYRANMQDPAQGENGFNIPSLFGMAVGAPYFHGGNARTLTEVFDPIFKGHHEALAPGFLESLAPEARAAKVADLVEFLLSIDENSQPEPVLTEGPDASALDHDFCR